MAEFKYVYKLKSDNKLSPHEENLVKIAMKGDTAKSVNVITDAIPNFEGLFSGVVEINEKFVCFQYGYTRKEVFALMNKWLDKNFELKEVYD